MTSKDEILTRRDAAQSLASRAKMTKRQPDIRRFRRGVSVCMFRFYRTDSLGTKQGAV